MSSLEKFGEFLTLVLRDKAIEHLDEIESMKLRAPAVQKLQAEISSLDKNAKAMVKRCVIRILDTAMHDMLASFQESHDLNDGIEVIVDGENIAELSGMLNGEIFGDNGWISKYSKYSTSKDILQ